METNELVLKALSARFSQTFREYLVDAKSHSPNDFRKLKSITPQLFRRFFSTVDISKALPLEMRGVIYSEMAYCDMEYPEGTSMLFSSKVNDYDEFFKGPCFTTFSYEASIDTVPLLQDIGCISLELNNVQYFVNNQKEFRSLIRGILAKQSMFAYYLESDYMKFLTAILIESKIVDFDKYPWGQAVRIYKHDSEIVFRTAFKLLIDNWWREDFFLTESISPLKLKNLMLKFLKDGNTKDDTREWVSIDKLFERLHTIIGDTYPVFNEIKEYVKRDVDWRMKLPKLASDVLANLSEEYRDYKDLIVIPEFYMGMLFDKCFTAPLASYLGIIYQHYSCPMDWGKEIEEGIEENNWDMILYKPCSEIVVNDVGEKVLELISG